MPGIKRESRSHWWNPRPWLACDPRALALFRIGLCLHQFCEVWSQLGDFTAFQTSEGIWGATLESDWEFTLHRILFSRGGWLFSAFTMLVYATVIVCYFFGIHTHLSALLFHIFTLAFQQRSWDGARQNSAESWFRHMTFWAVFLPTQMWTVDECTRMRRMKKQSSKGVAKEQASAKMFRGWASIAVHFQLMIVYIAALLHRWPHTEWDWQECSAVYLSLARLRMTTDFGRWLAGFPGLCFWLCRLTLILEWLIPLMVWLVPLDAVRSLVLSLTFSMHVGFAACFQLGPYPSVSAVSLLPFLPPSLLDWMQLHFQPICRAFISMIGWVSTMTEHRTPKWMSRVFHLFWEEHGIRHLRPRWLNSGMAMLFASLLISNQLGQAPFDFWTRWDDGYFERLFRLSQNWNMFSKVRDVTEYDFIVADIHTGDSEIVSVIYNDLRLSNYQRASLFEVSAFQRHANPTHAWRISRWPRAVRMAGNQDRRMRSLLGYFCSEITDHVQPTGKEIIIDTRHLKKAHSRPDRMVHVTSVHSIRVCMVQGKTSDMWTAVRKGDSGVRYDWEALSCRAEMDCQTGSLSSLS